MKLKLFTILLVGLAVSFQIRLYAQEKDKNTTLIEDFDIEIPPLSVLLDSACFTDPFLAYRDLDVEIMKGNLKSDKRYWMRNLGVTTDARYGTFDHLTSTTEYGETPIYVLQSSSEIRYGFGAYLKLPLIDVVNRRNTIKIGQMEVEKAEKMSQLQREQVRTQVIKGYNELILRLRLFKIKLKQLETAQINMQMAEKEFVNGIIPVSEYARLTEITIGTELNFEIAKMDVLNAKMALEEITGMEFKVNKKAPTTDESN
ncbi:MAG: TolC family protein [Bacteroidales bacterium]|nr:TolC family protein [Bacteroidales bacterium]MBK7173943.1 TolC family protein [Bacteroidales bacterium]